MESKKVSTIRTAVLILNSLMVSFVLLGVFLPVRFDAGACGGGFRSYLARQEQDKFHSAIAEKLGNYEMISTIEQIADTIDWSGHTVYADMKIQADNKTYRVYLKGKRYWYERYSWKLDKAIGS